MKELLQQYAAYNAWANQKIIDCISNLPDEVIHREINSSFTSVYKTLLHSWYAEDIWLQRIKLTEQPDGAANNFTGTYTQLAKLYMDQSNKIHTWVSNATETQVQHVFAYLKNKEQFKQPVWQVLVHVFNHGTYHRGQLITMLRQLDAAHIPNTDFLAFSRKK